ncbi:MAG: YebC/PmpR family DNA-binding transcriptional regulator [Planctomycetaceae bacterium]|nr:YebC/PmpR family DNA-binding transcriptional regulator [Planctomycetaceae bacterium]
MAGHSHWANISIKKGIVDKKRGKLFGKLNRAIMVAAQNGGGDPASNLPLRYAIDKARKASMPKDTIERAIKKGCGENLGQQFSELLYEGYGPGGVAVLCEILTDNRNRTAGEVRKIFEVHGGNLGSTNCVAWMFDRKGFFVVSSKNVTEERLFEVALEAGADDVKAVGENFEVTCPVDAYQAVIEALETNKIATETAELTRVPQSTVELDAEVGSRMLKLIDALEDQDDIQNVISNFNMSEAVMQELANQA